MAPIVFLSFFWLLRLIPTTFVSLSFLYEAAEKGEEKKEEERRKKKERTRVKTMVSQVATHSARNSPVPKFEWLRNG